MSPGRIRSAPSVVRTRIKRCRPEAANTQKGNSGFALKTLHRAAVNHHKILGLKFVRRSYHQLWKRNPACAEPWLTIFSLPDINKPHNPVLPLQRTQLLGAVVGRGLLSPASCRIESSGIIYDCENLLFDVLRYEPHPQPFDDAFLVRYQQRWSGGHT